MACQKVEICLKEKTTPSTNIPLLSLQNSEQQNATRCQNEQLYKQI